MAERKKIKKNNKENQPKSYKNTILIFLSLIMFIYSGLVLLYPAILTMSFNKKAFCASAYKTSALVTTLGKMEFKMTPKLDLIITAKDWESKHIDNQNAFKARTIEVVTTPFATLTNNYNIKSMRFEGAKIWNQILPDGNNKLAYIAKCFSPKDFGVNKITIKPSEVKFDSFTIIHEINKGTKEEYHRTKTYSQYEVKTFLMNQKLLGVVIK